TYRASKKIAELRCSHCKRACSFALTIVAHTITSLTTLYSPAGAQCIVLASRRQAMAISRTAQKIRTYDPIWDEVRKEAAAVGANEPALGGFIYATILSHDRLEDAICHRLAQRLNHSDVDAGLIGRTFALVLADRPEIGEAFRADLAAVFDRD